MKKTCLFLLIVLSGASHLSAQDFLVTKSRDTLNCTLGKLNNGVYPITFMFNDTLMSGTISQDSVMFVRKNFFRSLHDNRLRPWYPYIDVDIDIGTAHHIGVFQYDDEYSVGKSKTKARTGVYAGAELTYWISKRVGYGLKYNIRHYDFGKCEDALNPNKPVTRHGTLTEQFVGPMILFRFFESNRKNNVYFSFAPGFTWLALKDVPITIADYGTSTRRFSELHANTVGGSVALGYNYRLSRHVSAHLKMSYMIGYPRFVRIFSIENYTIDKTNLPNLAKYGNNINSLNLALGITFHK
ncbi:MAG: hypothetical protein LBD53_02010 [Tannerella sp.]|jgi:hypothetical protein|nr:hypothetical protein [Tannerella sp.]